MNQDSLLEHRDLLDFFNDIPPKITHSSEKMQKLIPTETITRLLTSFSTKSKEAIEPNVHHSSFPIYGKQNNKFL